MFQQLPSFLKETNYKNPSELLNSSWQHALQTKLSFFDWLGGNSEALDMFTNHMAAYTSQRGTWEDVYPIGDRLFQHGEDVEKIKDTILVDLGGGSGHDLKRFASHFLCSVHRPCLVLQELPEVAEQAESHGDLPATIQIVPIDLTKESPVVGSRAYFMHSVLHDWPDVEVRRILEQMHSALSQKTPDGRTPKLLLNENVLLKQGVQPQPAALDLIMMAAFSSHERTEDQWKALLESAGYRITAIFSKAGIDEAVIEAEAVEQFQ
ncbi:S-adenosyl-L-methionine-dependent methyltransferase [Neohortaea acidophila]|uniref:S-adenosyl-L-methionine-dependent methyltransferase n=1 Tax=Neohortaea acidophila TaxID=245834 RepID=A0A6A6PFJ3_9PEZI|nr:S-adenosyl-L-methionine-dependent methyltransferase [Neohortaea acidophila]KAF2478749.1 S-adenosyl-L-methionine-dependent methyltransferase [Neohortaea acidophila]